MIDRFRPLLTEMKAKSTLKPPSAGPQSHKRPAPPEQTHAERFYWVKQMQAHSPVCVVLTGGETLHGVIEWYDDLCIKLTRIGSPNVLIYKQVIKSISKDGEEAAKGGNSKQ
jgi:sRNA-binding regulator protein Hfq